MTGHARSKYHSQMEELQQLYSLAQLGITNLCPWKQLAQDTQVYRSARLVEFMLDTKDTHSFRALQLSPPTCRDDVMLISP